MPGFQEATTPPLAVAVIAADPLLRQGTEAWLDASATVKVVPVGHSATDCLLILTGNVGNEELAWMRQARLSHPDVRVVLVADAIETRQVQQAVELGLASLLLRPATSYQDILEALLATRRERLRVPTTTVLELLAAVREQELALSTGQPRDAVDARELQVLRLLAQGQDTREIAAGLNYSQRTIKAVVQHLCSRWQVRNRTQAVAIAIRRGII